VGLLPFFSAISRMSRNCSRTYPKDQRLLELDRGERDTDNLSPWPGVTVVGERMHQDEFMRRTLSLTVVPEDTRHKLEAISLNYLAKVRAIDPLSRAFALASHEDGGFGKCVPLNPDGSALGRIAFASISAFFG
jgi:hypothetical protein